MTFKEFMNLRDTFDRQCREILDKKGASYAGKSDKLANFKRIAERLGVSPLVVWSVYFMKHVDAILQYVKDGVQSPEGIAENFKDARNYIDLGYALGKEIVDGEDEAVLGDHNIPYCAVCGHSDNHDISGTCRHIHCFCPKDTRKI
jgi:hypothetical protein